ncbi:MAG: hypothetical protein M0P66_08785 [Salinivirgaceae bacterium]|nr:hypothetical protein [Salinivirgaceae bacterium]
MRGSRNFLKRERTIFAAVIFYFIGFLSAFSQQVNPMFHYTISIPDPGSGIYQVELQTTDWENDTVIFKMSRWMPGYYQIMDYANSLADFWATDPNGNNLPFQKMGQNSWMVINKSTSEIRIRYNIKIDRQFVANSFVDTQRAYLVPGNTFLYVEDFINVPVQVKIVKPKNWNNITTGLPAKAGTQNEFAAPNFDILFDCPILIGNLEELVSFYINGIEHRFIGFNLGIFDKVSFIDDLKKVVKAGVDIIGDIPYEQYTFIGIGPGLGGIEHLNNTIVSFDGNTMNTPEGRTRMLLFLGHEYFHNYNVKRIRPFELGPFDYENENRTNLLWISEGFTVYYEYLMLHRAGLINENQLISKLEEDINALEQNPGKHYQSLTQASYYTWEDGPFGRKGEEANRSISYYQKGPVIALLLDFAIRNTSKNEKSLDDVMRYLYFEYYKKNNRGFTDAEFQKACELIAGTPLEEIFEYISTTKPVNYNKYLNMVGLSLDTLPETNIYKISRINELDQEQEMLLKSWLQQ